MKITYDVLSDIGQHLVIEPISKRIKIYQIPAKEELPLMIARLFEIASEQGCDKLIFYTKHSERALIRMYNAIFEGVIKGFFEDQDAYIYSLFLNPERGREVDPRQEQLVMDLVQKHPLSSKPIDLPAGYELRLATKKDASSMAQLYHEVFTTYPTPMNQPDFIEEMMEQQVYFTVVEREGAIVSACSADILPRFMSAEMTDCVTLPQHRGKQLLSCQFLYLIPMMRKLGVTTLFSYSRAVSIGMNLVNCKLGFSYGGRLVQNSQIAGRLESMNIWYKRL